MARQPTEIIARHWFKLPDGTVKLDTDCTPEEIAICKQKAVNICAKILLNNNKQAIS